MDGARAAAHDEELTDESFEVTGVRRSVPARERSATRVEVDLDAIVANAQAVRAHVGQEVGVLAMLKGDAYGHGLLPVARALGAAGVVAGLVVTSARDGLALRHEGVGGEVLVMGGDSYEGSHRAILEAGLVPVIASATDLERFARAARAIGSRAPVHVKLDTGMSRLGVQAEEVAGFLHIAARHPQIVVTGLATHFALADDAARAATDVQTNAFQRAYRLFLAAGHRPVMLHAANTAATFRHPQTHFTHVRTGIALFGGDGPSGVHLAPAMRFVTHVAQLRTIEPGQGVSYGHDWRAARRTRIATLPVGYAVGYPRRLTGSAEVLVRGRRCPVVGAICMEMTMVDVTDLGESLMLGEEVVLFGDDGADEPRVTDLARATGGIVEEIFCGIPASVTREHMGGERCSAVRARS